MPAYKDKERGTWYINYFITDWRGKRVKKAKRGFKTRKEALEYERIALLSVRSDLNMSFKDFFEIYKRDIQPRLKENTWLTKEAIVDSKIMPYIGERKMKEISVSDIIQWQNTMMGLKNLKGELYSCVYLKTINNQISSIFNHAVNVYNLAFNPVRKAGKMGKEKSDTEIKFWTKDEYLKFAEYISDRPDLYYAYEMLYWCGLRIGEVLALRPCDFDFEAKVVKITRSYQLIKKRVVITPPKTTKSIRIVSMPDFLVDEIKDFMNMQYKIGNNELMFTMSKSTLNKHLKDGGTAVGLEEIHVHCLRHSHVSLLIEMGYTPLAIAERVGHESISITYKYAHLFPNKQKEIANGLNNSRGEL